MYLCRNQNHYGLRSHDVLQMSVPRIRTELGKKAFQYAAPSSWNDVQKDLKLSHFISLEEFKSILDEREYSTLDHCTCS